MDSRMQHRSSISLIAPRAAITGVLVGVILPALVTGSAQTQSYNVLYSFRGGTDGASPVAGLLREPSGKLYGTTMSGTPLGNGTVFRLERNGKETVLHSFTGGTDGANPTGRRRGMAKDGA